MFKYIHIGSTNIYIIKQISSDIATRRWRRGTTFIKYITRGLHALISIKLYTLWINKGVLQWKGVISRGAGLGIWGRARTIKKRGVWRQEIGEKWIGRGGGCGPSLTQTVARRRAREVAHSYRVCVEKVNSAWYRGHTCLGNIVWYHFVELWGFQKYYST